MAMIPKVREAILLCSVLLAFASGFAASSLLNQPPAPWLEFGELIARYKTGATEITLTGRYTVKRVCPEPNDVIWRTEAIATDGQVAVYGPKPAPPSFALGNHAFEGSIPLLQELLPDGWVVRVLVTCPQQSPETVSSPAARVQLVQDAPLR